MAPKLTLATEATTPSAVDPQATFRAAFSSTGFTTVGTLFYRHLARTAAGVEPVQTRLFVVVEVGSFVLRPRLGHRVAVVLVPPLCPGHHLPRTWECERALRGEWGAVEYGVVSWDEGSSQRLLRLNSRPGLPSWTYAAAPTNFPAHPTVLSRAQLRESPR